MFSYMFAHEAHHRRQAIMLETYGANDCMNQLLLEHVDARAWRARQCPAKQRLFGNLIEAAASEQTTGQCV